MDHMHKTLALAKDQGFTTDLSGPTYPLVQYYTIFDSKVFLRARVKSLSNEVYKQLEHPSHYHRNQWQILVITQKR